MEAGGERKGERGVGTVAWVACSVVYDMVLLRGEISGNFNNL